MRTPQIAALPGMSALGVKPPHKCKAHGYSHDYTKCPDCGHEYCDRYWAACPSCNGSRWQSLLIGNKA